LNALARGGERRGEERRGEERRGEERREEREGYLMFIIVILINVCTAAVGRREYNK
jgi:hypothetical protein